MEAAEIEKIEIRLLIEAIHERYGYDLRGYAPSFVDRRVRAALVRSGFAHLGELQHRVLHDGSCFAQVLDELIVRVTDMFRDPEVFAALREHVAPLLRTYPLLRIWHAGCATGEEVYACAILLSEEGLYDRTQIYATDLSVPALDAAKEGVYPLARAQEFAVNHVKSGARQPFWDHVTEGYERVAMREPLRRNIVFFQHDLVCDQAFAEMHVIFCRNVLIYFNRDLKRRVMQKLVSSLRPGGFLCLGASEQLSRDDEGELGFREIVPRTRIYRYDPIGSSVP